MRSSRPAPFLSSVVSIINLTISCAVDDYYSEGNMKQYGGPLNIGAHDKTLQKG